MKVFSKVLPKKQDIDPVPQLILQLSIDALKSYGVKCYGAGFLGHPVFCVCMNVCNIFFFFYIKGKPK